MARLLAYLSASSGNTFPAIDMLLELQRRGHEVHLRSRASDVDGYAALGLCAAAIDPSIEQVEFDDWRGRSQVDSFMRMVRAYRACANLEIPDLRQAVAEVDPDALIVDINCFGAMFVAEASELPWAVYCPYPPPFRSDDVPPHGLGLRPARGPLGKARDLIVRKFGDRQLAPELAQFNDLRADLGLPTVHKFDDQFLRSDRFIAFTAEPYEYHRSDWPPQVRLVGPGLWEPPADPPAWLEAESRPIVLVTASTAFQLDAKLITTALEALAGEDLAVVATTAAQDPAQFHVPSNARVEQFLPHGPILARASMCRLPRRPGNHPEVACRGRPGMRRAVLPRPVRRRPPRRAERRRRSLAPQTPQPRPTPLAVQTAITKRPGAERIARAFETRRRPARRGSGGRRTADRPRWQDPGGGRSGTVVNATH